MIEDKQIIQEVLSGKTSTFKILVEKYQRLVAHVVFRMVSNTEEREDICQEVFIKVYSNLNKFRFEAKFSTWIARVAYNTCINNLEKKKASLYDDFVGEGGSIEDYFDNRTSPSGSTEAQETSECLKEEIEKLPISYRAILTLFHLEGMSYLEIGEVMDLPEGTVKSYLFRARKKLKELLINKYQPEELL
jgi:RNA polymerase sigma-70 factor (ECF subfamily)